MTTTQLAKKTGLHPKTLGRFARENVIPGVRIGGSKGWLFDFEAVQQALGLCRGNKAQRVLSKAKGAK